MKGRMLLFTGAAALMLLAACGDDSGSSSNTTSAPAASGGGSATTAATGGAAGTIVAKDIAYNPTEITVKVGDTITFKNEDGFAHTFTADNGDFDSGNVDGGAEFQYVADEAGTIAFHCKIHGNMKGTITVEAA